MKFRTMKSFLIFLLAFGALSSNAQGPRDQVLVYFEFDRADLTPAARKALDSWAATYADNKGQLMIRGFCDARGTDDYNDQLSERRAEAVQNYLLKKGIPEKAIVMKKGFGEREPLNGNATDEERQQNRRVELSWHDTGSMARTSTQESPAELTKQTIDTARAGSNLRLRNINFYGGRHTFLPQSIPALEELLDIMKNNPTLEIEIQGYICCQPGSDDGPDYDSGDNYLSRNRARAVYEYLVNGGIDKKRMNYVGLAGTKRIVDPEITDADRTLNRRVELKILKR